MASDMKWKCLPNSTSQIYRFEVHTYLYSTERCLKDVAVFCFVYGREKWEYLLSYWVEWRNTLHIDFLSVLTDIAYPSTICLNIAVPQLAHICKSQTCEYREKEYPPHKLRFLVLRGIAKMRATSALPKQRFFRSTRSYFASSKGL